MHTEGPGIGRENLLIAFSRPARKDATDQNLLRQNFIAYIFGSQEGKRPAPSPKKESPFNYIFRSQSSGAPKRRARSIVYIFRSKRAGARARKRKEREWRKTPSPLRRSYSSLRTHHSLIGCSPWQSYVHGKGRVQVVVKYPWHMRRLFVYHLEHRMSAPSCDGECGGGSQHSMIFSFLPYSTSYSAHF